MKRRKRIATDLQILDEIHRRYHADFRSFDEADPDRTTKHLVPISVTEVAASLGVDPDSVLGRLYYDLNQRYQYRQKNDTLVPFFSLRFKNERHCINFPYMEAVLANLRHENKKYRTATTIAVVSLFFSVVSLLISTIG